METLKVCEHCLCIEILGREAYLSGTSRSAFHWSCVRETDKIGVLIYFDSSRLFKQKED